LNINSTTDESAEKLIRTKNSSSSSMDLLRQQDEDEDADFG
jgi:hypothetical protein